VPSQVDRDNFVRAEAPWLVLAFTSATCNTCADIERKVVVLESPQVAVQVVEYSAQRALHDKYGVDAVPSVLFSDRDGVVRASFIGPVSATDLWAGLARVRDGSDVSDCRHAEQS
jgi:thioredoxin-related protein